MVQKTKSTKKSAWKIELDRVKKLKNPEATFINLEITPDDATEMLQGNENNRHLNKYLTNKYTRLMNLGKWVLNGETIKIAVDGRLLDGQHRLNAVSKADEPVRMTFAFGLSHDHFKTIDTGRARSAGDVLKIAGYKNVHTLSAATRWMLTYQIDTNLNWTSELAPEDILDGLRMWPKLAYFPQAAERLRFITSPSTITFFMYVTQFIDSEKSFDFFNKLETGEKLNKRSPVLEFRNLMMKYRAQQVLLDKRYTMSFLINTWNAYYNDIEVKTVKWQSGQPFPQIEGLVDRKRLFKKNSL